MKKTLFLLFSLLISFSRPSLAIDNSGTILSLVGLSRETVTKDKVTTLFGKPAKIEENKKRVWWSYTNDNTTLVFCWNKKSNLFENYAFKNIVPVKTVCDAAACRKLKSGSTDVTQAIKLLGTPADMKTKNATQELHYTYQNSVLRLFFRDRILVDFTLLGQVGQ
jgi:hypothetical protein